ncbi:MAG: hypothetical protein E6H67_01770 [Betaproteobacteria bacterium]|nr:MAG: hypothetical protein E6H67_01770 [Betaproteobacteria bacterium]
MGSIISALFGGMALTSYSQNIGVYAAAVLPHGGQACAHHHS